MEASILKILFLLIFVYSLAPTVVVRLGHIGAVSRAPKGCGRVALTFDDGPDPLYTPQILEILHRYQVRACFFLVGAKARANPEITRQIIKAGHEIGSHGYAHKAAWLLGPRATSREIGEASLAIEEVTGQKIRFCRPAWGLFNLFSIWYCRLKGLKVILWTYMSWDWTKKATPESVTHKVLSRIRDGAILVLHDSDATPGAAKGSPSRVVEALPRILDGLKQRGLQVAPLEEIMPAKKKPFSKKVLQRLWSYVDRFVRLISGISNLGDGNSIWRIALRRHRGKDWTMPGGNVLKRGELYLELHMNNDRLLSLVGENALLEHSIFTALREVRSGLPLLAKFLNSNEKYGEINTILGITLLHRGLGRFGFKTVDMKPGIFQTFTSLYERWLLAIFHPDGFKGLKSYRYKLTPKYVVITRQELMSKRIQESG
ncbi:polysaccharide deacetylase family protein [Pelotomaculum propionicicum]|uniref:Bifunctional xylanase/deacetylase n=1 Tax=Pelotomaculum propionicicum TaxID=258475 RepID=A0A4Y7RWK9_9FIRM|nr:polysaccharide deacetylase family protein [Pelotomaculum propionicicum]TEB13109.1 Bifunctional xylanase/deacetylase [Pelotomaculum propionicicum]